MNLDLYKSLSQEDFTHIIAYIISNNILSECCISSLELNKRYLNKKCTGNLKIDMRPFKAGDYVNIFVDLNIIKVTCTKYKNVELSYTVLPEVPKIRNIQKEEYNSITWNTKEQDLKIFFNLNNFFSYTKDNFREYYKCYATPKENIGILQKDKEYLLIVNKRISIYNIDHIFLDDKDPITCLVIDYPMPILIENKTEKL